MSEIDLPDGSENFKQRDASSYDLVAEDFDRFTDRLGAPLVRRMIALAELQPHHRVLDIGTGSGSVALQAGRKLGPNGRMVGVDLSEGLLATAKAKAVHAGLTDRVEFHSMDAEALDLEDCSFDVVLSMFALLHFPNPLTALKEMLRVLRPGGKLVIGVGSGAPLLSLAALVHVARRLPGFLHELQGKELTAPNFLNALVEKHLPGGHEPEQTLLASQNRNQTRSVPRLVRQAGFTAVASYWEGHEEVFASAEEFWTLQRTYSSIARKRLTGASAEKIEPVRDEFFRRCREVQSRGGRLIYRYAASFVTGIRS